jgi:hypothetical protein
MEFISMNIKLNRYGNPITNRKYRTQYQNVNRNNINGRFVSKDWSKIARDELKELNLFKF